MILHSAVSFRCGLFRLRSGATLGSKQASKHPVRQTMHARELPKRRGDQQLRKRADGHFISSTEDIADSTMWSMRAQFIATRSNRGSSQSFASSREKSKVRRRHKHWRRVCRKLHSSRDNRARCKVLLGKCRAGSGMSCGGWAGYFRWTPTRTSPTGKYVEVSIPVEQAERVTRPCVEVTGVVMARKIDGKPSKGDFGSPFQAHMQQGSRRFWLLLLL